MEEMQQTNVQMQQANSQLTGQVAEMQQTNTQLTDQVREMQQTLDKRRCVIS